MSQTGQVDTEYVTVESEHSSMSTCIGAEAAGCPRGNGYFLVRSRVHV